MISFLFLLLFNANKSHKMPNCLLWMWSHLQLPFELKKLNQHYYQPTNQRLHIYSHLKRWVKFVIDFIPNKSHMQGIWRRHYKYLSGQYMPSVNITTYLLSPLICVYKFHPQMAWPTDDRFFLRNFSSQFHLLLEF